VFRGATDHSIQATLHTCLWTFVLCI